VNKRIFNISLRGLTLISRFFFIFFLAKYLEPAVLGAYGIFTATVGYALYFVGLDFYVFTTREILKSSKEKWGGFLKDQAILSSWLYLVLIFALLFLVFTQNITIEQSVWFFFILIFEHLNQEISRLLVALHRQTVASVLLFIRQGIWAIAIVIIMMLYPSARNLDNVFILWLISGITAFIIGNVCLRNIGMGGWRSKTNYGWIKSGIKVSGLFLIATLALRGIQTVDRYWIQYLNGLDVVGAYVLFIGMASTLMTFLDAGVFSFSYPTLISLHNKGEKKEYNKTLYKMIIMTIGFTFAFIIASILIMPYLLAWTGKVIYFQYLNVFYWLIVATLFNAFGMISHYALYAQGKDKPIIYSHLSSILIFIVITYLLSKWTTVLAVPIGLTASFLYILVFKTSALWLILKTRQ